MYVKFIVPAIAALSLAAQPTVAQELTGTLKKIKDTGTITLGHRESSVPFSYYDDKQQVVGYAMDLCDKIVDAVKKELKLDKLEVKLNPVTSATRIPLMANGTVDLECGSTTNNLERQKQVAFTITHFVTANRFVSKKAANLQDGRRSEGQDHRLDLRHHQHQADHRDRRAEESRPQHPRRQGSRRGLPDGGDRPRRGLRDGRHPALQPGRRLEGAGRLRHLHRCAVGRALRHHAAPRRPGLQEGGRCGHDRTYKSGEINAIYDKWFLKPIPPKGINLNVPMSAAFKKVVANPTDSGDPKRLSSSMLRTRVVAPPPSGGGASSELRRRDGAAAGTAVNYHWNWGIFWQISPDGVAYLFADAPARHRLDADHRSLRLDHRARARLAGRRDAHHAAPRGWCGFGNAYVELFRNIPLLVQMFLWYFVLPEVVPRDIGDWLKQLPERLVLYRRRGARPLHLGARRRAGAGRHQQPAARPAHGRARARASPCRRPTATCCCRWPTASSCRR